MTTGIGGFSITNNSEYAVEMRSLVNHGRDNIYISIDDDNGASEEKMKEIIKKRFSFISIGHSFRITEMEGALGLAQLETKDEMIIKRKANAEYLTSNLRKFENYIQLPKIRPETDHVFMMYPIVLKNEPKKDLVEFLEKYGIETRDMLPLICQPIYKEMFKIKLGDYPVSDWVNSNGFYIASHQDLTKQDLDHMVNVITQYFVYRHTRSIVDVSKNEYCDNDTFVREPFSCCI